MKIFYVDIVSEGYKMTIKIITFEGPDGFGKTTYCKELCEAIGAEYVKFPNEKLESGGTLRKIINKELPYEPVSFQALNIINRLETLQVLEDGKTYIFDRYKLSGIIYGILSGVSEELVEYMHTLLPDPDLTFIILGRCYREDNDIYSAKEFQENVLKFYTKEAMKFKDKVVTICNTRTIDEVMETIIDFVELEKIGLTGYKE